MRQALVLTVLAALVSLSCKGDGNGSDNHPVPPGTPCAPGRGTCGGELECIATNACGFGTCTARCETDADCEAAGIEGGCCARGADPDAPGVCLDANVGPCLGLGPGAECPDGVGCRADLCCIYISEANQFRCTERCETFDDCRAIGIEDGCCQFILAGNGGGTMCLPGELGVCAAAADGGARGGGARDGADACDGAAQDSAPDAERDAAAGDGARDGGARKEP